MSTGVFITTKRLIQKSRTYFCILFKQYKGKKEYMIASFGKITFKVTEEEIKIFDNFNITRKARYVAHERINNKPLLQFMGLDADSISFNMQLVQGVTGNVSDDLKTLQDMFKKAEVHPLFLGQKKLGSFIIESINEAYKIVDNLGNLEIVNVSLSLKEYVG